MRVSVVIVRRYCLSDLDSVIAHLPFVDAARYLFCTWVSALYHRPAPVVLWPPVRLIDETCLAHSSPIPDSGFIPAFWITNTHSCLKPCNYCWGAQLELDPLPYLTLASDTIRYHHDQELTNGREWWRRAWCSSSSTNDTSLAVVFCMTLALTSESIFL